MVKRKRGRAARNARKAQTAEEPEELVKAPHSFIINRSRLGKYGNQLLLNFRKIMEPYTASQLRVNCNTTRRCVFLDRDSEDECISLRHFAIKFVPSGMSKAVKKLIQNKVPDLGHYQDFDDFMNNCGNLSESEAEVDGPTNQVVLPQAISSRGNIVGQQSAMRLFQLGPIIKLELVKIEEGVMSGEVLFHKYVKKLLKK